MENLVMTPSGRPSTPRLRGPAHWAGVSAAAVMAISAIGASAAAVGTVRGLDGLTRDCAILGAGANPSGQLGLGDRRVSDPVAFELPSASTLTAFSGGASPLLLTSDGVLRGRGANSAGQLGSGGTDNAAALTDFVLPVGSGAVTSYARSETGNVTIARTSTGKAFVAGGDFGATPIEFALSDASAVSVWASVDGSSVFVITGDGALLGQGANSYGQLGNGTPSTTEATPVQFGFPELSFVEVVSRLGTTLARTSDGRVWGAGRNNFGQLGNGATQDAATPVAFELDQATAQSIHILGGTSLQTSDGYYSDAQSVAEYWTRNLLTSYVVTEAGAVLGAGANQSGQLGTGDSTDRSTPVGFPLGGELADQWHGVSDDAYRSRYYSSYYGTVYSDSTADSGQASVWIQTRSGKILAVGSNTSGQLGDGTTTDRPTPVEFGLSGSRASTFSAGRSGAGTVAAVLSTDGHVFAAGLNLAGQLGVGDTDPHTRPARFLLPEGAIGVEVDASPLGVSVRTSDGEVYSSGNNDNGRLGDGSTTSRSTPVAYDLGGRRATALSNDASDDLYVAACPRPLSVGGIAFNDADDNGTQDAAEAPIGGATVRLYRRGITAALTEQGTDSTGGYVFTNLASGAYFVEVVPPTGYHSSTDTATSSNVEGHVIGDDNGVTAVATGVRTSGFRLRGGTAPTNEGRDSPDGDNARDVDSDRSVDFGLHKPTGAPSPQPSTQPPAVKSPRTQSAVGSTTLSIAKRALRKTATPGQLVTYRLTVKNTGKTVATEVIVCDRFPRQLVLSRSSGPACITYAALAAGEARRRELTFRVRRATVESHITNSATAAAANAAPTRGLAGLSIMARQATS